MADYNNITLDIDEEGIWLIDNTDQGDMQMGHVSWRQIAIHVQKELEKLKGDDTDAQVNFALKEAQERTKGMLTEGCCHHQACHARGYCMADRIEELEAENKKLRLEVYHANDVADVSIDKAKELEAKLDLSEGALDIASRSWGECQPIIKELEAKLQDQTQLIEQLFALLDIKEQKDDGRYFHPTTIRSCRALDAEKLEKILGKLRGYINE